MAKKPIAKKPAVKKPTEKTKTYLFHKLANELPLIEGEEFDTLVNSIKEDGQKDEGILFEGKILDGRNRYNACKKLGIPFKCSEFTEDNKAAVRFVLIKNVYRRHLTVGQRASLALPLLEVEMKEAEERKKKTEGRPTGKLHNKKGEVKERELTSIERVAPVSNISTGSLERAYRISKIAKADKYIAEQWENAKRGKVSLGLVYEKAKIIDNIKDLPEKQKAEIKEIMVKEEKTAKQIKEYIQNIKDNLRRAEMAKKSRESEKSKEEREKAHLKIRKLENVIINLKDAIKSSDAKIIDLSNETLKKYPDFKSADPDNILTSLDKYYDSLDVKIFDKSLKELKVEYEELMKPLYEKIKEFEDKYSAKKDKLIKQKKERNAEVEWIEHMQNEILGEYDNRDLKKENIEKYEKEIKELKDKYLIS